MAEEILGWIASLFGAAVLALLVRQFGFELVRVKGKSMTDTLRSGELVLVTKPGYLRGNPKRCDVVICRYPGRLRTVFDLGVLEVRWHRLFIKRVVGLPGDRILIREGCLYVNGEPQPDPEAMASPPRDYPETLLGQDQYFVMGDNRGFSHDSRAADVKPLKRNMILGRARVVLWPLNRIRIIK